MKFPTDLLYSKSHEWVKKLEDNKVQIGLTDFAQSELGDVVFVNLPEEGEELVKEESFADVESVKAVSDVFSPIDGEVTAINEALLDEPELINSGCYDAWLVEATCAELPDDLINATAYETFIKEEG